MRPINFQLKFLLETLETCPEIGAINMDMSNDNTGVKGAVVTCMFNTGYTDYIKFGITTSHKFYFARADDSDDNVPRAAVPAITLQLFYNSERIEIAVAMEDIKNDPEVAKDIIQIMEQINHRLLAKEERWFHEELGSYDLRLSLREISNAKFVCKYIKERVKKGE